jgi:hypothetical protein
MLIKNKKTGYIRSGAYIFLYRELLAAYMVLVQRILG